MAVARTCGKHEDKVSKDEAIEIAKEEVDFAPCPARPCVQVRAVQRGIPPRLVWIVGLAQELDDDGKPLRGETVIVDAATGEISRP
ncbi:MAG: PepSY domain-containing protein [Thermoleophilia bacterium]|nr:PepSY domain-containing protein [Gaiellaceae bacterium]MDW8337590.1 PepSY domain-containing protein [Thermoleophilia bacterium]